MQINETQAPNFDREASDGTRSRSLLVLYVNDSFDDQVLLQAAVKKAGVPMEFHVADSLEHGVSYLKSLVDLSRTHDPRWVDLVLLDILLRDGSGLTILKFIRQTPQLRRTPVVILTGLQNPIAHKAAYTLGADAVHEKPSVFEGLVQLSKELYFHWSHGRRRHTERSNT
jgi:CheY-like chemotaxis protein